jgi:predicted ATPase/DNA-binding CsgD family transcriptional regulator
LAKALRLGPDDRDRLMAAVPSRRSPTPPVPLEPRPATTLPAALTSFVGRERELAEVGGLLGRTRLLTLTGAGGVGKTRLALEAARAASEGYSDGVWLVELASLTDPALVPRSVAAALALREQPDRPILDILLTALATRRLLLVLDNCEHLLDACAALADALLRACPDLRILTSSREPLGIAGETIWRVPSLALPDPARPPAPEEFARSDAVRLFTERAVAALPSFALTAENAAAVAAICRRLDGIPLALELAAARVRALGVEQIADRLDDACRLLTVGNRAAPPRQRTLRATIDWSHAMLSEPERTLLRRLSVFAGGWTLAAAEAVGAGEDIAAPDVLDLLARLVDKSLVQAEERDGEPRYRLLETVRQYAAERLDEAGEGPAARDQHRDYFLALVERAAPALLGPDQAAWLDRIAVELDNLRAALAWCADHDPRGGLGLAIRLTYFWRTRCLFAEGRGWLERLLARSPEPTERRAEALLAVAYLAIHLSDLDAARGALTAALALSRRLGQPALIGRSLQQLADIGYFRGDYGLARACLEEALSLLRAATDWRNLAAALYRLGQLQVATGEYERAEASLAESLALQRAVGNIEMTSMVLRGLILAALGRGKLGQAEAWAVEAETIAGRYGNTAELGVVRQVAGRVAWWRGDLARAAQLYEAGLAEARADGQPGPTALALIGLGQVALRLGDLAGARALLADGLALCRERGNLSWSGMALHGLGLVAWRQGDAARAVADLSESLALRRELGERPGIAECLEGLAAVAAGTGRPDRAARLLGAAGALRAALGAPLPPIDRPDHEATVAATRAALGGTAFAAAWADRQALSLDEAEAYALADEPEAPAGATERPLPPTDGLTRREIDILRLLAAGRSNREIAADLSLSARTVERHITNIYGKIDARGRADATAYAFHHALA